MLAEVYLAMTGGQGALELSDAPSAGRPQPGSRGTRTAATAVPLVVLTPSAEELEAHEVMMAVIDRASGGRTPWPLNEIPAATVEDAAQPQRSRA